MPQQDHALVAGTSLGVIDFEVDDLNAFHGFNGRGRAATMAVRDVVAEVSDPASAASAKPSSTAAAVNAARLNKRRRSRLNSTDIDPAAWLVHSDKTVAPRVCAERARYTLGGPSLTIHVDRVDDHAPGKQPPAPKRRLQISLLDNGLALEHRLPEGV